MKTNTANNVGWALVIAVVGLMFFLDQQRLQHMNFNAMVVIMLVCSSALVLALGYMSHRVHKRNLLQGPNQTARHDAMNEKD